MPPLPRSVEVAAGCASLLGEAPVWHAAEQALYWVDIKAPAIMRLDWSTRFVERWTPPCRVTALAPRRQGGFIAATEEGFAFLDGARRTLELLGNPEPDLPGNRLNDGKVDRTGAFWAGTMDDAEQAASGSLYRLDETLVWSQIDSGYRVTNGPAFSPDGAWLYHTDSPLQRVYRFALRDGAIGPRELFLQFTEDDGSPDGMTIDAEGGLWIAFWDGWCLRRFAPDGSALDRLDLPVQRPTSCTFGGPALDRLFITSARIGLSPDELAQQPLAGALFVAQPSVAGVPQIPFAG